MSTTSPSQGSGANPAQRIARPSGQVTLRSLAPDYVEEEHGLYLRHLKEAVAETKNRNIALTGRYGSGKSSVLNKFEEEHEADTVRISINTLGPDPDNEGLTNRIQKELVKQLIYRAEPGLLRRSRFARTAPLTKIKAALDALVITSVLGALLGLLGILPHVRGTEDTHHWFVRAAAGLGFAGLAFAVILLARWVIGDRVISQFKAAGTAVQLEKGPDTYFDKYLDELVTYFDDTRPKYVIFEDLDRFDDAQIFDSLRELNTLINTSANWKDADEPLRFIYAIKDSLFEKLGDQPKKDTEEPEGDGSEPTPTQAPTPPAANEEVGRPDAATEAVKRANRTKFFEVVIPVVPFISHRTARDHVLDALQRLGFPEDALDRRLLDLVARHATEMRLLLNICNEFAVYAEKLLWVPKPAPGMTNEHLFALVAYKNFHLADFEGIPQRASVLDLLEDERNSLVRHCIEQAQTNKRTKKTVAARQRAQANTAAKLGNRLLGLIAGSQAVNSNQRRQVSVQVGGQERPEGEVTTVAFWKDLLAERSLTISRYGTGAVLSMDEDALRRVFEEAFTPHLWKPLSETELARELSKYDAQVALLQGAGYDDLAKHTEFKNAAGKTFAEVIDELLTSELARDLVKRGYLTHNFAEYSATFYGKFTGTDVAYFYNRSVQPNQALMDFKFDSPASLENLLEEAPADFTTTRSAFNINLVSYLLREERPEVDAVAGFMVDEFNSDAQDFLRAFLNDAEAPAAELIAELTAVPWSGVFDYLVAEESLPDEETRLRLFDAALLAAEDADEYGFGDGAAEYLRKNHLSLASFIERQTDTTAQQVFAFARRASLQVANLGALGSNPTLQDRVIEAHAYELSAANLRSALGVDGPVGVEETKTNTEVWSYCAGSLSAYLQSLREDDETEFAVRTEPTLVEVLTDHHEGWEDDELGALLELTDPAASVKDLESVPPETWASVVAADRLQLNVANLVRYTTEHDVDQALANILSPADGPLRDLAVEEDADEEDRLSLAVTLLNADEIADVAARVGLVAQLGLPPRSVPAADITSRPPRLLELLLTEELVDDDEATFRHFLDAGWEAVEDAFKVSATVEQFFRPDVFASVAGDVLSSRAVPERFKMRVLDELDLFVLDTDGLEAAAKFAVSREEKLPLGSIQRIARETRDVASVSRLLVRSSRDINTEQLVETLVMLGGELAALANGPGSKFPHPEGEALETLFGRLKREGRIKVTSKMFKKTVENRS